MENLDLVYGLMQFAKTLKFSEKFEILDYYFYVSRALVFSRRLNFLWLCVTVG